ncbi:MAG: sigma-70 family RNA polymerase sigma factor [Myxococcales bacterium FL481]|nr:MAG: sigma-70 family RNA polymerase sigma factor [Myxococcales bacterium FL481]
MPPLTAEQAARVEAALPRVARLAVAVHRLWPRVPVDDFRSAGHEGLVQAAMRYDPACGVTFESYCHSRVKGAMLDQARRQTPGARRLSRAQRAFEAHVALHPDPSESQIGVRANLVERVERARHWIRQLSAATVIGHALEDTVADTRDDPESGAIDRQLAARVRREVAALEANDRALIEAIYVDGQAMSDVAERLGVNRSTVSRRHRRIVDQLSQRLGSASRSAT